VIEPDDTAGTAAVQTPEVSGDAPTGNRDVDSALERLHSLADLPAEEHVAVYEQIHAALQDTLQEAAQPGAGQHGTGERTSAGQEAAGHPR
jgi:hypothetical protein